MPKNVFKLTERPREGSGTFGAGEVFEFEAEHHASPTGQIDMPLTVTTSRKSLPGTEEPVEQVISSSLEPFQMSGEWSDRWNTPGFALDTWKRFEALVRRANLVEIEFVGIRLVGLITNFTPGLVTPDVVPWSITFSPHARGGAIGNSSARINRSTARGPAAQLDTPQNTTAYKNKVVAIKADMDDLQMNAPKNQMAGIGYSDTAAALADFQESTDQLEVVSNDSSIETANSAVASFRQELAVHRQILGRAQSVIDETSALNAEVGAAFDDVVLIFQYEEWIREMRRYARTAVLSSWQAEQDLKDRINTRPVGRHRAKKGESVYEVSQTYYGTPDEWKRIHEANNIFVMEFEGGEELLIPNLVEQA